MIREKVKKLKFDIEEKFNMSFNNTGLEIMNAYGYDQETLEDDAMKLVILIYTNNWITVCSSKQFVSNIKENLDFAMETDVKREILKHNYNNDDRISYTIRKVNGPTNIVDAIEFIVSLYSDEVVDLCFNYYSYMLGHVYVNKDGVQDVVFDPVDDYDYTQEGTWVTEEFLELTWIHAILSLSKYVPICKTFKVLRLF